MKNRVYPYTKNIYLNYTSFFTKIEITRINNDLLKNNNNLNSIII